MLNMTTSVQESLKHKASGTALQDQTQLVLDFDSTDSVRTQCEDNAANGAGWCDIYRPALSSRTLGAEDYNQARIKDRAIGNQIPGAATAFGNTVIQP